MFRLSFKNLPCVCTHKFGNNWEKDNVVALAYLHNMHWQIIIIIIWTSLAKLDNPTHSVLGYGLPRRIGGSCFKMWWYLVSVSDGDDSLAPITCGNNVKFSTVQT